MTFLCLSTFLSLVFQQDAQSLLGEKRTEYLFCSTSEKWSPEPLTSTPLETELNVTKESLISWGKLNRGCTFDSCHSNFQGFFSPQLHLTVCTLLSSPQVNATHCCGTNRLGEERSQILKECQSHARVRIEERTPWTCCCPVHQVTGADSCTKFLFHYHTRSFASLKCSFPKKSLSKATVKPILFNCYLQFPNFAGFKTVV